MDRVPCLRPSDNRIIAGEIHITTCNKTTNFVDMATPAPTLQASTKTKRIRDQSQVHTIKRRPSHPNTIIYPVVTCPIWKFRPPSNFSCFQKLE